MYCSPAWNPVLTRDINVLEAVQHRYTKCIGGLRDKPNKEHLSELHTLTLESEYKENKSNATIEDG